MKFKLTTYRKYLPEDEPYIFHIIESSRKDAMGEQLYFVIIESGLDEPADYGYLTKEEIKTKYDITL